MSGFSDPVFSDDDEPFRGEMKFEDGLVALDTFSVPRAYWKVIVIHSADGLHLAAYLMDQFEMLEAGVGSDFDLEQYRLSLTELEKRAQLRFSHNLHQALALPTDVV